MNLMIGASREEAVMGTWSKRDIRILREQMTAQGRELHDIANEVRVRTGCSMLMAYRLAAGWSQNEVVDRFVKAAPGAAMDQTLLSRLEAFPGPGTRRPLATQIITLASIFQTNPLRLLTPDALDRLDEHERAVLVRCGAALTPPIPLTKAEGAGGAPERPFQESAPPTHDPERQVQMAARRALRFTAGMEASNVGSETVAQLQEEVARLAAAYPQTPLPELLADLADLQDVAFRLLEGRQRPAHTADLYLVAGVLSGMMAKASHDLGQPHAAMTQARTAYVCADNIGHDGLRAWTAGLRSMIAYWAGRGNEAVRYAQQGAAVAEAARGTASVWLPAQEARCYAVIGDSDRCRDAIERAKEARESVVGDELDDFGGIMSFPAPRQEYYAADAKVWLPGEESDAERAAVAAIRAYEDADPADRSFSDEAGAHSDLALARAAQNDVDGAAEALAPVLALPPACRIEGIRASVMRVHRALGSPVLKDAAGVRDLQEKIEAYAATPSPAAWPPGR
ncbi:hypothetical protein Acsp04_64800 [Actinomadura sp. NBRC 104425]|uniref:hypothetical protein n=1 Tax=Actinomadura sp. NBRC 104425 TaxID=3032204 RepID=UPI0024A38590|nr:hypothetical protein [Actinomadura sp. NBRC 104425]GLZ16245.1 hypothetical protein Acsp04_64800 [Actinomadura sp. NBRC 104425]